MKSSIHQTAKLALLLALSCLGAAAARAEDPEFIKRLRFTGAVVEPIGSLHGLRGWVSQTRDQTGAVQAQFYWQTADGEGLVAGLVVDQQGAGTPTRDLFAESVAKDPGLMARLAAAEPPPAAPPPDLAVSPTELLEQAARTAWFPVGGRDEKPVPVIYMLVDPNCVYCHNAWAELEREGGPLATGKVQIRVILVAFLQASSFGRAASILSAKDPVPVFSANEDGWSMGEGAAPIRPEKDVPQAAFAAVQTNTDFMKANRLPGTPIFMFSTPKGESQVVVGTPRGVAGILKAAGVEG